MQIYHIYLNIIYDEEELVPVGEEELVPVGRRYRIFEL